MDGEEMAPMEVGGVGLDLPVAEPPGVALPVGEKPAMLGEGTDWEGSKGTLKTAACESDRR